MITARNAVNVADGVPTVSRHAMNGLHININKRRLMIMSYEVVVKWIGEDIEGMYPKWHISKCEHVLDEVSRDLEARVIEFGNDVLEQLVNEWISDSESESDDEDDYEDDEEA